MNYLKYSVAVLSLTIVAVPSSIAAVQSMSREDIVQLVEYGVGYSYYWGHGAWRTDGASHGSCSGSCPNCTHSGSYGADCSGFVAKVWQVPGPVALDQNSHPYSTYNFRYESTHWSQVSRSDAQMADAFVHRNSSNTGGHIVLYDRGDPWGQMWTWEARGCSYGIVHNLRSADSSYVAIRRDELEDTPSTGTLIGAVYVDRADGDTSERIPGASVFANSVSTTARSPDAIWSFDLDVGDYKVTANAAGFVENSRSCAVDAGETTWCSIGLAQVCVPDCAGRVCGPDGCGGTCGGCQDSKQCNEVGKCVCVPDCTGIICGPDPVCGQSCGTCDHDQECMQGVCMDRTCSVNCENRECGPDPVCGGSCGTCPSGLECSPSGGCVQDTCQPTCAGLSCGADPVCGKSCGVCSSDEMCTDAGQCDAIDSGMGKLFGVVHESSDVDTDDLVGKVLEGARIVSDDGQSLFADENAYWEMEALPGARTLLVSASGYDTSSFICTAIAGTGTKCFIELSRTRQERQVDSKPQLHGGCSIAGRTSPAGIWMLLAGWILLRRKKDY